MERLEIGNEKGKRSLEAFINANPIVKKAFDFGQKAHQGQFRKDGVTPYFDHCVGVARIMHEEWGINNPVDIAVGFLHDTVEDTDVTIEDLRAIFGEEIAFGVNSITNFKPEDSIEKRMSKSEEDMQNAKKVFAGVIFNPVVAIYKLADRLYNVRDLGPIKPEKRFKTGLETINVFAPLAESLGMWEVMKELEDISLREVSPEDFNKFSEMLKSDPRSNDLFTAYMTSRLSTAIESTGVEAEISTLTNGLARLRHKMIREHRFSKINDVVSFRIVIDDSKGKDYARNDAYKVLGLLREVFGGIEDEKRFDDFFFKKQANGYSAIQVTLDFPFTTGKASVEVAITTRSKEEFNKHGVISLIKKGDREIREYALKLIFTPTGEVKFFKQEATGWDFAYSIEKYMGAQAVGLKIDGESFPMSTVIPNASTVEIIVGEPRVVPDPEAINFVLAPTRKTIESQMDELEDNETIAKGKEMLSRVLAERGLFDLYDLIRYKKHAGKVVNMLRRLGCKRYVSNLYRMVGLHQIGIPQLEHELDSAGINKEGLRINSILIEGSDVKDLLGFMGKTIAKHGGNIKPMTNEPDEEEGKEIFRTTLLVEDLPQSKTLILQQDLLKNQAINRVEIV